MGETVPAAPVTTAHGHDGHLGDDDRATDSGGHLSLRQSIEKTPQPKEYTTQCFCAFAWPRTDWREMDRGIEQELWTREGMYNLGETISNKISSTAPADALLIVRIEHEFDLVVCVKG